MIIRDYRAEQSSRDPYSFFLKVVSRASIPKNMLALAKFWLPFQKWRIIGKKKTFFWANNRSNWEADWQISQNVLPPAEAVCDVADADSDAGTNFSQGLFFCHEGRKARRRSSVSYFACFSPASLFFFLAGGADTSSKYRHMLFSRSAVKPRFRV